MTLNSNLYDVEKY